MKPITASAIVVGLAWLLIVAHMVSGGPSPSAGLRPEGTSSARTPILQRIGAIPPGAGAPRAGSGS